MKKHDTSVICIKKMLDVHGEFHDSEVVEVDKGIVKVVLWINSFKALSTSYSCEGCNTINYSSYVQFETSTVCLSHLNDVIKAVKKVNNKEKNSISLCMNGISASINSLNVFDKKFKKVVSGNYEFNKDVYDISNSLVIKHRYIMRFKNKKHIDLLLNNV